jgi:Domain of unknown function
MAIVKMIGNVDGNNIIFEKDSGDLWIAAVPKGMHGEYVIDIIAYDNAGNEAYSAAMIFIVDPYTLEVRIVPANFSNSIVIEDHKEETKVSEFAYIEVKENFDIKELQHNYYTEVIG